MENEFKNILEKINGDPIKVADLLFELGLTTEDLKDHANNGRIYEVLNYLLQHPNPPPLIAKLTLNKPIENKVDHLWSYFKVVEQKQQVSQQLEKVNKDYEQLTALNDMVTLTTVSHLRDDLTTKYNELSEQESYY
jgi:hypothetical protein